MLNTVLSSRVCRVDRVRVSVRFSGRYKNLGPPFIGLQKFIVCVHTKIDRACITEAHLVCCFLVPTNSFVDERANSERPVASTWNDDADASKANGNLHAVYTVITFNGDNFLMVAAYDTYSGSLTDNFRNQIQ